MTAARALRVRIAGAADAVEIARLSGELGYPADPRQMHERLSRLLLMPAHFIAIAERDGGCAGWIHAEHRCILEYGDHAELAGLVVDAAARRAGVARALVAAAEQWATGRRLSSIMVRSNVLRPASHPFYEALGYVRQKTQHAYAKPLGGRPAA